MKAETILIDQPEKQSVPRRVFYGIVTIVAWVLWALLWLPILHTVLDRLNLPPEVVRFFPPMVLGGAGELAGMAWVAPAAMIVFLAWSLYDGRTKKGGERRRRARPVPLIDAAESIGTTENDAELIHDSRRLVLHVDDEGHIDVSKADAAPENVSSLNARRRQAV